MAETFGVDSGKATLVGEARGEGLPVVFLHAGVADRRMWQHQLRSLGAAPGFRAVAYDRRGFGDTLHADERYSHVRDLYAVLDAAAPGGPAILVGCSQGGRVALDAALSRPERVRGMLLVAPAIGGAPEVGSFPPAIRARLDAYEAAEAEADVDRLNQIEAELWLDGPTSEPGRVQGVARELFLAMNEIALRTEVRGEEIEPPPAWSRLPDIAVPTLFVCGSLDFPSFAEHCHLAASRMQRARTLELDGVAHLPSLEAPERLEPVLREFLAGVAQGGASSW